MVLVTLGALLTPVQWKRSILGVPSATLCKMLQPVASFPPPSAPCRQSGPAFLCSSHKEEESCHTMVICQAGKAQAIQFVCWDGMGHGLEGGEQEFTQLSGSPLGINVLSQEQDRQGTNESRFTTISQHSWRGSFRQTHAEVQCENRKKRNISTKYFENFLLIFFFTISNIPNNPYRCNDSL